VDRPVLIIGERGTGKELAAARIHFLSQRWQEPFIALNCAALASTLIESELFGHEAGAFTGALGRRIGKFEYANGGTLFLDEVGEMPMDTQIKLLRVLEDRIVSRLGANEEIAVNVRLVAATNADLEKAVESGKFREDLYYRLKVITIYLPPLRERRVDIPLLIDHFRKEFSETHNREIPGVSRAARQALMAYDWPGNIRQLRNTIECMFVLDTDGLLDVDDLPSEFVATGSEGEEGGLVTAAYGTDAFVGKPLKDVERYYLIRALELTVGNREEAANMLGIGERTLYRKINEYGLKNQDFGERNV